MRSRFHPIPIHGLPDAVNNFRRVQDVLNQPVRYAGANEAAAEAQIPTDEIAVTQVGAAVKLVYKAADGTVKRVALS